MKNLKYQRWLAVGLLFAVLMVFVLAFLLPLFSNGLAYYEKKNDLLFRLHRQQKVAARKDSVAEDIKTVKQHFSEQGYFSNRDTEALASADLQNTVKTAVTDAGGQLTSTQGLPGKADNGFNRVAVRVRMTCKIEAVRAILLAIENAVPVLIVDQIDISPVAAARRNPNIKLESSGQLNVSFQVVSFMRGAKQ